MSHRPMLLPCAAVLSLSLLLASCGQPTEPPTPEATTEAPATGTAPGTATPDTPTAGTPAAPTPPDTGPAQEAAGVSGGSTVTTAAFSLRPLTDSGLVRGVIAPGPEAVPAAGVAVKNVNFKVQDAGGKVVLEKTEGTAPY